MSMNTPEENRREDFIKRHEGQCVACKYYREVWEKHGRNRYKKEYCAYHDAEFDDICECDSYKRA